MSYSTRLDTVKSLLEIAQAMTPDDEEAKTKVFTVAAEILISISHQILMPPVAPPPPPVAPPPAPLAPPPGPVSPPPAPELLTVPPTPPASVAPAQTIEEASDESGTEATQTTNGSRRDFTRFCKSLNLPTGHKFFVMSGVNNPSQTLTLAYNREGKARLEARFADGTLEISGSPSGIVRSAVKKLTGKNTTANGWKRLHMRWNSSSSYYAIGNSIWLSSHWNSKAACFTREVLNV
jgi:hypothetical protein